MTGRTHRAIGVDVGGTKIAAGRRGSARRLRVRPEERPTRPERGGGAILDDVVTIVSALTQDGGAPSTSVLRSASWSILEGQRHERPDPGLAGRDVMGAVAGAWRAPVP